MTMIGIRPGAGGNATVLLVLLLAWGAPGCGGDVPSPGSGGNTNTNADSAGDNGNANDGGDATGELGTLRLFIADKPYPYPFLTSAVVTVERIDALRSPADGGTDDPAPHAVLEGAASHDLIPLRNGRMELLVEADVPTGSYGEFRVLLSQAVLTLTDQREFLLTAPSGDPVIVPIGVPITVETTGTREVLLDVDVSRVFPHMPEGIVEDAAGITDFGFEPQQGLRVVDLHVSGRITGTVLSEEGEPLAAAVITAFLGSAEVSSTATEDDGTYTLVGLPAASYRLEFSATGFEDARKSSVAVIAGIDTADADALLIRGG
jgi:hypothetical protein